MEREPDYAACSFGDLLDVEGRIDKGAYPERWKRLQEELAKRRATGATQGGSTSPLMGLASYVIIHLILCPVLGVLAAFFLDGEGEGAGMLTLIAAPVVAAFSLGSFGTYAVYRDARHPERFVLISIALWTGVPFLIGAFVSLLVWGLGRFP